MFSAYSRFAARALVSGRASEAAAPVLRRFRELAPGSSRTATAAPYSAGSWALSGNDLSVFDQVGILPTNH
ncbi:hypothetical protein [Streptomyces sp. AK02-01A]|uniref:hypothetical protein n=1 Tax=Streptomyces sp. AK02-01A TaxID=3028648 RepID=UPI0029AA8F4D|nr:hypothetical protein [Streptomyces sp. AK02-01A]MDX3850327.1 hypothetical protein [Streptomyces sp. AK02-01A]